VPIHVFHQVAHNPRSDPHLPNHPIRKVLARLLFARPGIHTRLALAEARIP
jgi:hypothetical protein